MGDDINKAGSAAYQQDVRTKKRIPVYILILAGIFLLALVFYMAADMNPKPSDAPPGHPNPGAQPATMNSTTTGAPGDEARARE